jgi:hypothetical protein
MQVFQLTMKDDYKKSLLLWQLIPNFFIMPLPILVRCKTKGAAGAVCAMAIRFLIANYCWRRHCNFKGLSQAGKRAKLAENLRASPFNKEL